MENVTDKYLEVIDLNTRKYSWSGVIRTKDNKEYPFDNKDILKGSGYISKRCAKNSEIEIGSVYASELAITLIMDVDRYSLYGAEIKLFFHLDLGDEGIETIEMGVFEIAEASRTKKFLEIKAYDYMLRFDKKIRLNSSSGTAFDFLKLSCETCSVALKHTEDEIKAMPNGDETLGIYIDNDIDTYRDLIYYVGQVLGGFSVINRKGELEIVHFKREAVKTIDSRHRFTSSYSDFITRYTAVSSTNLRTEEAEYYSLEEDDGLTLNLDVNPLLQFGLKSTRERLINNILLAVSEIEYVPFESTTIGDPALDLGDVLRFTGSHADENKVSAITGIDYKINGKHSLKCVGKNPLLSTAKSKNDKNITGLMNKVETGKIVVYNFINASSIKVSTNPVEVIRIDFTSKEETTAQFYAELLLSVVADEVNKTFHGNAKFPNEEGKILNFTVKEKASPNLLVTYKMNSSELTTFKPKQSLLDGNHILNLFLPITEVLPKCENSLSVYLSVEGGKIDIAEGEIRATISGQGLVAGVGDWNGRIEIKEKISFIPITRNELTYLPITDELSLSFPRILSSHISETFGLIEITKSDYSIDAINERVTAKEVIKTFTMDNLRPPSFDEKFVHLAEDKTFRLISDYDYLGVSSEIDYGYLKIVEIKTGDFAVINTLEVRDA